MMNFEQLKTAVLSENPNQKGFWDLKSEGGFCCLNNYGALTEAEANNILSSVKEKYKDYDHPESSFRGINMKCVQYGLGSSMSSGISRNNGRLIPSAANADLRTGRSGHQRANSAI